jgi:hypothetical protein
MGILAGLMILEAWIGRSQKLKSSSILELIFSILSGIIGECSFIRRENLMDKPFDIAALVARVKPMGLELTEELAKSVAVELFAWIRDSVTLTENKYDDFFLIVEPRLLAAVTSELDRINPADNAPA